MIWNFVLLLHLTQEANGILSVGDPVQMLCSLFSVNKQMLTVRFASYVIVRACLYENVIIEHTAQR